MTFGISLLDVFYINLCWFWTWLWLWKASVFNSIDIFKNKCQELWFELPSKAVAHSPDYLPCKYIFRLLRCVAVVKSHLGSHWWRDLNVEQAVYQQAVSSAPVNNLFMAGMVPTSVIQQHSGRSLVQNQPSFHGKVEAILSWVAKPHLKKRIELTALCGRAFA